MKADDEAKFGMWYHLVIFIHFKVVTKQALSVPHAGSVFDICSRVLYCSLVGPRASINRLTFSPFNVVEKYEM